jgi:hypothetical protein
LLEQKAGAKMLEDLATTLLNVWLGVSSKGPH